MVYLGTVLSFSIKIFFTSIGLRFPRSNWAIFERFPKSYTINRKQLRFENITVNIAGLFPIFSLIFLILMLKYVYNFSNDNGSSTDQIILTAGKWTHAHL